MARPLRIEFPGALYHVTSHGDGRRKIFRDDADRESFLATLTWVVARFGWHCHAYCLMDHHYDLLIETPQANLSRGMRQLNGVYTQNFNRRHRQADPLFRGRFKAIVAEKNRYLLELARYIVLNPVRAKLVNAPARYPWSSYRATLGLAPLPPVLAIDAVLAQLAKTKSAARKRYADFVSAGIGLDSPLREVKGQVLLGGAAFVKKLAPETTERPAPAVIAVRQRLLRRPTLKVLLRNTAAKAARNQAVGQAFLEHGYTLLEIGRATGLHFATISRIVREIEKTS